MQRRGLPGKVFSGNILQLFQIAVRDVVAAPIRHGIKLNAMRELHLVFLKEALKLTLRLGSPPTWVCFRCPLGANSEVDELDVVADVI